MPGCSSTRRARPTAFFVEGRLGQHHVDARPARIQEERNAMAPKCFVRICVQRSEVLQDLKKPGSVLAMGQHFEIGVTG
jgi:hypothetical protein